MKKIILTLIAVTLAIGLYRSFSAASYEAQAAAAIQLADTGAEQPADQTGTAQVGANTQTAAKASACGGSCNPATCGCSPAQCAGGCGGGCGGR
jgi:hypothetical protein